MTDAELDALVATMNGVTMGLCSEDASQYLPRGVSAQTCVEAATALTTLRKQRDELREALESVAEWQDAALGHHSCALDMRTTARRTLSNMEGE